MTKTKYIVWECLKDRTPAFLLANCNSISEVDNRVGIEYPVRYKNEPPYPYIFVQLEEINELGNRNTITYCYYGQ